MNKEQKRILLVEDEESIAEVMKTKLEVSGYAVTHAPDGEVALAILDKETFDLILLDLVMPKVNGFEVLETMQREKRAIPVVVTTNLGQTDDMLRAKKLGVKDYLLKADMSLSEMVEHVEKVLGK